MLPCGMARMLSLFPLGHPAGLEVFLEVFTSTRAFLGSYPVKGARDQEAIMYNVGDGGLVGKVEPELELLTQV